MMAELLDELSDAEVERLLDKKLESSRYDLAPE
jgi:hypothetical protein